jgi:hypothetical protein
VYNNHKLRAIMPMLIGPHLARGLEAHGGARRPSVNDSRQPNATLSCLGSIFHRKTDATLDDDICHTFCIALHILIKTIPAPGVYSSLVSLVTMPSSVTATFKVSILPPTSLRRASDLVIRVGPYGLFTGSSIL